MAASRLQRQEPGSDGQEPNFQSPLTKKPILMKDAANSPTTSSTLPASIDTTIAFNDKLIINEIDCNYTEEETRRLWFTKSEYDEFLKACDEDAQRCEDHEKEGRIAKLKDEIRNQRRQRMSEETQRKHLTSKTGSEKVLMDKDMDGNITDDTLEGEKSQFANDKAKKVSDEGNLCSLGLEAWTLEGYKTREHHRQKAIDTVLNEQYAAWDRGHVENAEMISALYFSASAISKHSAAKKAKDLENNIREYMVLSTLSDYSKAVEALNVLQKSLHCIRSMNDVRKSTTKPNRRDNNDSMRLSRRGGTERKKMNRRASNESVSSVDRMLVGYDAAGSNERKKMNRRGSNESASSIDRMLAVTDTVPRPRMNELTEGELILKDGKSKISSGPQAPALSGMTRKKTKPRSSRISGPSHNVYKSKASTNIIVAPPTPPVVKAGKVRIKPSAVMPDLLEPPMTDTNNIPKSRKPGYKHSTGGSSKHQESFSKSSRTEPNDKARRSKKIAKSPSRRRSLTPDPTRRNDRNRSSGTTTRNKSTGPIADNRRRRLRSKSPRPSAKPTQVVSKTLRKTKKVDNNAPVVASVGPTTDNLSTSTHSSSRHKSPKKEHWWYSKQRQEAQ